MATRSCTLLPIKFYPQNPSGDLSMGLLPWGRVCESPLNAGADTSAAPADPGGVRAFEAAAGSGFVEVVQILRMLVWISLLASLGYPAQDHPASHHGGLPIKASGISTFSSKFE